MFRMSCEELHYQRVTKTIQTVNKLFEGLAFDDLVKPEVKLEMSTTCSEVFERYSRIFNPEGVASSRIPSIPSVFWRQCVKPGQNFTLLLSPPGRKNSASNSAQAGVPAI